MLTIAIDTSTKNLSVSLYDSEILVFSKDFTGEGYIHSEKLLPFIQTVLNSVGKSINSIDRIILSLGPGSYTGLRIGAASVKALAYSLDIPVYGINSTEVLFWSALKEAQAINADLIVSMIDARRDEVYQEIFELDGTVVEACRSVIITQDEIDKYKGKTVLFCGDGAYKFKGKFDFNRVVISEQTIINKMTDLSSLIAKGLNAYLLDPTYFDANYIKPYQPGKKKSIFN